MSQFTQDSPTLSHVPKIYSKTIDCSRCPTFKANVILRAHFAKIKLKVNENVNNKVLTD